MNRRDFFRVSALGVGAAMLPLRPETKTERIRRIVREATERAKKAIRFKITGARTSRTASSSPNFQNVPRHPNCRCLVVDLKVDTSGCLKEIEQVRRILEKERD